MQDSRRVPRRKTLLIILDGFGLNPSKKNNAVYEARTPRLDEYFSRHPHAAIEASGRAVGLPVGQMGNSEVGHLTLGCGAIVRQDLVRIDDAIKDGSFFSNNVLLDAIRDAKSRARPLHLIGLVSDGGVHSHTTHLLALIRMCREAQVIPMVHMITDGRDTPPKSATNYLDELERALQAAGGQIATIAGRYFSMDRDRRWDRVKKGFDLVVHGIGRTVPSAREGILGAYTLGQTDEFLEPMILPGATTIAARDALVFFNFRNDRPRELALALGQEGFEEFDRGDYHPITVTSMTAYDSKLLSPIVFPPERPKNTLAKVISFAGYKQFHCAETEKYPHVTYFFNGGREPAHAGEDRKVVPSPQVTTYDLVPEMSAAAVADEVIKAIETGCYAFVLVNFANGDMVGHAALRDPIIRAVETLDTQAGRVLDAAVANDYSVVLTADHGNCEEYIDPLTGEPNTQHTTYPVPFLVVDSHNWRLATGGGLSNVAPTILQLMGLQKPDGMDTDSMLLENLGPVRQGPR
ncbi:MAG: 2,3-bisphosphoglycerate-independent phosphoglycerate mutase [Thiotrichales bacterium]